MGKRNKVGLYVCIALILFLVEGALDLSPYFHPGLYALRLVKGERRPITCQLELKEKFSIPASGQGYELVKPTKIAVDLLGNIYVLDFKSSDIKIFDPDGHFARTVGRPGAGPGELDGAVDIFFSQGEIGVNCAIRRTLIYLTPEGRYLRTIKMPLLLSQMLADDEGHLFGVTFDASIGNAPQLQIVRYSPSTRERTVIASRQWKEPAPFTATLTFAMSPNKQIIVGNPERGFVIQIFDPSGVLKREIRKGFSLTRIRASEIDKMLSMGPSPVGIPKYYEPYYRVFAAEGGIILVEVHEKIVGEGLIQLNVFDDRGNDLGDIQIKRSLDYCWTNGKLYAIQDDAEGLPIVKVFTATWHLPTGSGSRQGSLVFKQLEGQELGRRQSER
jgi:hypothetical protein